jgi:hypothetical protein
MSGAKNAAVVNKARVLPKKEGDVFKNLVVGQCRKERKKEK